MIPGFFGNRSRYNTMTEMVLGKVVDVHPEHNSVDIRVANDRRKLIGVPVLTNSGSGNTGAIDLPVPDLTTGRGEDEKWESGNTDERDIMAIVAFPSGAPVCLGFVYPPITQMTFEGEQAKERRLNRHASDFYSSIDKDANVEVAHPNGTWFGLTETPRKTRLTGADYDRKWHVKRNISRMVHGVISWWNGQTRTETARAHLTPEGSLDAWAGDGVQVRTGRGNGNSVYITMRRNGTMRAHANTTIVLSAGGGSSPGHGAVSTPSFQPSENPSDELYSYEGPRDTASGGVGMITISADGDIVLQPRKTVYVSGDLEVSGKISSGNDVNVGGDLNVAGTCNC